VREVDQLEDSVDERVAECDQGVDRSGGDPDQKDIEEVGRGLDRVDREPGEQQQDEDDPDDRENRGPPAVPKRGERRLPFGASLD
jgi:hypothetical protein